MYYASEGLSIYEFETAAARAAFVLAKKGRSASKAPTCSECGCLLAHQEPSHYVDREFYYVCLNGHTCHADGTICSSEHLDERDEARQYYDDEE